MAEEPPTERVVRVHGEFSLLPQYLGEDVKALKARVLLDPRFQMVHYLDAEGLERTASGQPPTWLLSWNTQAMSSSPARHRLERA